jgi:lactoylglutathione lyase
MNFRYTILYVHDVSAALEFYNRAFGLEIAFLHEGKDYGELKTGNTKLAFSSIALMTSLGKSVATTSPEKPSFELAFETTDVASAVTRATGVGATLVQAPKDMPWGQTIAYVRTPEGTLVELCTAVKS